MRFSDSIYKDGKFWLVEIPILDLMTQENTKKRPCFLFRQFEAPPNFIG